MARKGGAMAAIVSSTEISRPPEEVFRYATDPARLPEWQESAVATRVEGDGPIAVGSRLVVTRRVGRRDIPMTTEVTTYDPPSRWAGRGIDGPVRGIFSGTVESVEGGTRSRVTIELDFEGHGLGKLLVPLVVRPQARKEMRRNMESLKAHLERGS